MSRRNERCKVYCYYSKADYYENYHLMTRVLQNFDESMRTLVEWFWQVLARVRLADSRGILKPLMWSIFHFQPLLIIINHITLLKQTQLTWMNKVNNFQIAKFSIRVLLSFYLILSQSQPGVTYKSVAFFKKNVYLFDHFWHEVFVEQR